MMKNYILTVAVAILLFSCAKPIEPDRDVMYYKQAGDEYLQNGKYTSAINAYQNALARAEDPNEAALIQLAIADAYYADKSYIEAIPVYEIYLDLYPNSPASTVAYMKLGLAHYKIHESANKDLADASSAVKYFQIVERRDLKLFYDNGLQAKVKEMRELLALKEYKIARYYSRIWEDNSSILRYEYLLKNYIDTEIAQKSFYRLIRLLVSNNRYVDAYKFVELYSKPFVMSDYYNEAKYYLESSDIKRKEKEAKDAAKIKDNSTTEIKVHDNETLIDEILGDEKIDNATIK